MPCPSDSRLLRYLGSALSAGQAARVEQHLDGCEACRALLALLGRALSSHTTPLAAPRGLVAAEGEEQQAQAEILGRRYQLLEFLGRGGMGQVFRAVDRLSGQVVALKRVLGAAALYPTARQRLALAQEFRTLATLRHPNIISVLDYGFDAQRRPYFTMDLLPDAVPVLAYASGGGPEVQADLLIQLLRALAYLHHRGIVHRDLKPSNILVVPGRGSRSDVLKVLDFGLALREGQDDGQGDEVAGTLLYMAPELLRGEPASPASDIYAAGVLTHEVLTGHHPFHPGHAEPMAALLQRVLHHQPDLSLVSPPVRAILAGMLSKTPADRPSDSGALMARLAVALAAPPPVDPGEVRDSCLATARFVGRHAEMLTLRRALRRTIHHRGSALLISGESGAGKSRLLDELRTAALVEGVLVARGHAGAGGGAVYQVWQEPLQLLALQVDLDDTEAAVLATILPGLPALLHRDLPAVADLDVQGNRLRLLHTLRAVVGRTPGPLLVQLEDLHWADSESLALLGHLSAGLRDLPVLIVATYRHDEAPALPAAIPTLRAQLLRLPRLTTPETAQMVESLLGPAGRSPWLLNLIERETEGNAFFIVEVVRALAQEAGALSAVGSRGLPERVLAGGIDQLLRQHLARVPPSAQPFLHLAAVAGRWLDLALLTDAVAGSDAALSAGAAAGVLELHDQRWRFTHDKLRERLLSDLDGAARAALHARLARSLAARDLEGAAAAQIAFHYREACLPREAAHHYARAGVVALQRGAPQAAAAALEQARALHLQSPTGAPLPQQVTVAAALARARLGLGQLAACDAELRRVCALAGAPLPSSGRDLWMDLARHGARLLARRLGWLPAPPSRRPGLSVDLLSALATQEVYVWLGQPELAFLCGLRGLDLEEALDITPRRTDFRVGLSFLLSFTPLRAPLLRSLHRTVAVPADAPPTLCERVAIERLRVEALIHVSQARWPEAAACAAAAVQRAAASGDELLRLYCLLALQIVRMACDEYPAALTISADMEDLAAQAGNPSYLALALAGQAGAHLRLGRFAAADAVLARVGGLLATGPGPVIEALLQGLRALCAHRLGAQRQAEELAAAALAAVGRARFDLVDLRFPLTCVLEVYLGAPRPEEHRAALRQALRRLQRLGRRSAIAAPSAWLFTGRCALTQGRPLRALRALRRSLSAAQQLRPDAGRQDQALAHYWLGRFARGDLGRVLVREGARPHFQAALALHEALGAAWDAARARDELLVPS